MNKPNRSIKKRSGFTLTELIIVIAILLILSALAVVGLSGFKESGRKTKAETDANMLAMAINTHNLTNTPKLTDENDLSEIKAMMSKNLYPQLANETAAFNNIWYENPLWKVKAASDFNLNGY